MADRLVGDIQAFRDALPQVKAARAARPDLYPADFDWAISALEDTLSEVERLRTVQPGHVVVTVDGDRFTVDELVERYRHRGEMLARLEWAAGMCLACHVLPDPDRLLTGYAPHAPGCWLAAELTREEVG